MSLQRGLDHQENSYRGRDRGALPAAQCPPIIGHLGQNCQRELAWPTSIIPFSPSTGMMFKSVPVDIACLAFDQLRERTVE